MVHTIQLSLKNEDDIFILEKLLICNDVKKQGNVTKQNITYQVNLTM